MSTHHRPVASPPDISMDLSRLNTLLGFTTTSFGDALRDIYRPRTGGSEQRNEEGQEQER